MQSAVGDYFEVSHGLRAASLSIDDNAPSSGRKHRTTGFHEKQEKIEKQMSIASHLQNQADIMPFLHEPEGFGPIVHEEGFGPLFDKKQEGFAQIAAPLIHVIDSNNNFLEQLFAKNENNEEMADARKGVAGTADARKGVAGTGDARKGVAGTVDFERGVAGTEDSGRGVAGTGDSGRGVAGTGDSGRGVAGTGDSGRGVSGKRVAGKVDDFDIIRSVEAANTRETSPRSTGFLNEGQEGDNRLQDNTNRNLKGDEVGSQAPAKGAGGQAQSKRTMTVQKPKKLIQNQQIACDRLACNRWRRDPIKERLQYLTGTGKMFVEDTNYVQHLDFILHSKHLKTEEERIHRLASAERDREWLWAAKHDLDLSKMEATSLVRHHVERVKEKETEQNRVEAAFLVGGANRHYTIAPRTNGLDANRDLAKVKKEHGIELDATVKSGFANPRFTWQLHTKENEDSFMRELIPAKTVMETYLNSEYLVEDTMTLSDQEEEQEHQRQERQERRREAGGGSEEE